jgi:hypothetical protein
MNFMKLHPQARLILALALVLTTPLSVQSQTVFGMYDCGEWVNQANNSKKGWLLGYMSGLNTLHDIEVLKPKNPLDNINSANQIFLWMDNYCKTNPLKTIGEGGWVHIISQFELDEEDEDDDY